MCRCNRALPVCRPGGLALPLCLCPWPQRMAMRVLVHACLVPMPMPMRPPYPHSHRPCPSSITDWLVIVHRLRHLHRSTRSCIRLSASPVSSITVMLMEIMPLINCDWHKPNAQPPSTPRRRGGQQAPPARRNRPLRIRWPSWPRHAPSSLTPPCPHSQLAPVLDAAVSKPRCPSRCAISTIHLTSQQPLDGWATLTFRPAPRA